MSEAVRRLVDACNNIIIDPFEGRAVIKNFREAIAAVELELAPPFTVHKVVKTVAADDREVGNGKGGRL
jgi:hypothetical protein